MREHQNQYQEKKQQRNLFPLHMGLLLLVGLIVSGLSAQVILPRIALIRTGYNLPPVPYPAHAPSPSLALPHLFGGFSIDKPDRVMEAASEGINFTIDYGNLPSPTSAIGEQLLLSHMKVIDGFIENAAWRPAPF